MYEHRHANHSLRPLALVKLAVLVLTVLCPRLPATHCLPSDPCRVTTISNGQFLYGFPACTTPGTKRADLSTVVFDPEAATVPQDVLITVRALYGEVSVSVSSAMDVQPRNVAAGGGAQMWVYPNVTGGKFSIQLSAEVGYTKWQIAAFSQPTNVEHIASERALLAKWAKACCPADQNVACGSLISWSKAGNAEPDACKAVGNSCDKDGRLVRLQLDFQGSTNAFPLCPSPPSVLKDFTALRVLNLTALDVVWPMHELATLLSKLPDLAEVVLDRNVRMGGVLYMEACELFNQGKKLRSFSAASTNVSGLIPPCMFKSPQLEELNLCNTAVSGELPDFGSKAPLMYFNASAYDWEPVTKMLTGTLPPSISNLTNLAVLALNNNRLKGPLPDLPRSLEILVMQNNQLSDSLPPSLYALENLRRLHMERNNLSGTLSPELGKFQLLEDLWLTGNKGLSGSIAFEWTGRSLQSVHLSDTQISGAIPASFATLSNLRQISITQSQFITDQSEFAAALTDNNTIVWYNVSGNSIKQLPEGLKKLAAFTNFKIVDFVDETGNSLNVFDVSRNNMSIDPFPTWLLTALPNGTLYETLLANSHSYVYNIAGNRGEDSNTLACPVDRRTAQAASKLAEDVRMTTFCQRMEGNTEKTEIVSLETVASNWAKLPVAVPSPPPSQPAAAQQGPDAAAVTEAKGTSNKNGKGTSDDLGIILGCAIGATVLLAILMFLVFKYALQLRRKPFVEFKDGMHDKQGAYPAMADLGDSTLGEPICHSPPPMSDSPVPNKAVQRHDHHGLEQPVEDVTVDVENEAAAHLTDAENLGARFSDVENGATRMSDVGNGAAHFSGGENGSARLSPRSAAVALGVGGMRTMEMAKRDSEYRNGNV